MKSTLFVYCLIALLLALSLPGLAQVVEDIDAPPPAIEITTGVKAKGNKQNEPDSLKVSRNKVTKKVSDRSRSFTSAMAGTTSTAGAVTDGSSRNFGFSLFTTDNLTFEPSINIPTPKNYRLGPADDLIIDIWGASQATYRLKITPEGSILIPNLGPIYLSSMTIEEATGKITKELSAIYSGLRTGNSFIKVSLSSVRSIKVNLVGEIYMPGTYTLSSLATVFNALYAANGPSVNGSLRDVKVIRNNKTQAELDLYEFLLKGEQKDDIRLEDGDVVFIAPYQLRVDISGQIKRPGLFDMKSAESLKDLIYFAGGFTSKAYAQRIKVFRKTGTQRKVLDIPASQQDTFRLQNGDEMVIDSILNKFENRVEIRGAVYRPGVFALDSAGTLRQLIRKADGLKGDAFTTRINIYRMRNDMTMEVIPVDLALLLQQQKDIPLLKDDVVNIAPISDLHEKYWLQIEGEVRKPGKYPFMLNMTISDFILRAGGFKESASRARVEIARRVKNDTATKPVAQITSIYQFPISEDLRLSDSASGFSLKPYDVVSIRQSPGYSPKTLVSIGGEVVFPGKYSIVTKNDRISDLIKRAGSITPQAYVKGASLIRKTAFIPSHFDGIDTTATVDLDFLVKELFKGSDSLLLGDYTKMRDKKGNIYLKPIKKNKIFAQIPIDLQYIMKKPGTYKDLFLMPGDSLLIPGDIQTIKVTGAVSYPTTMPYYKGKKLRYFVNHSGGFAPGSQPSGVYVINANGSVCSTKRGFLFINSFPKIEPGATIVVPAKK